jgi:predicted DNA-binding transcriptional regulator AlpA
MLSASERPRLGTVGAAVDKLGGLSSSNHTANPSLSASIEPLATIETWAAALVVSVPTIERLRRAGKIPQPDVMIGSRLLRWKPSTIRAWIESGGQS